MTNSTPRTALVTGASRGLGRALAEQLAARGTEVVLLARHANPLEEVAAGIRSRGGRAHVIAHDVGAGDASAIAARVAALVGPLDLLIHNASTLGPLPMPELGELRDEALVRVFEVNVLGPQRLTRALLGPMRREGRGTLITLSSDAATQAYPGWGAYGASKAALDQLTAVLAAELEGSGLRAFAIDPGEMDTRMHADALPEADPSSLARPEAVAASVLAQLAAEAGPTRLRVDALPAGRGSR